MFQHSTPTYCDVVTSPVLHNQGTSSLDFEEPSHISLDCAHHSSKESSLMIDSESSLAHSEGSYRRSSSDNESVLNIQNIQYLEDLDDDYLSSDESNLMSSDEEESEANCKLYEGCSKTVNEAVLDLMENYHTNRESKQSLHDNLLTFVKYLPQPNKMPKSLHQLLKFVEKQIPFKETKYPYCSECLLFLENDGDPSSCEACGSRERKYFYGFSIAEQIKHYLECCNLADVIDRYQNERPPADGKLRDICDGSEYARVKVNGSYHLTLMWATDGISISNSSTKSFYPVQLVICEVPLHLRFSFLIVCSIWCDFRKPPMSTLMRPFLDSLRTIYAKGGVSWCHPTSKVQQLSSVVAPLASADAPVRADLLNMKSHNSKYACNTCEQKTEKITFTAEELTKRAKGKRIQRRRGFLFKEEPARLREEQRLKRQGQEAYQQGKAVKGVKGPSLLQIVPRLDLATFLVAEYMHTVCLGVVRHFLMLWICVPGPWCIREYIDEIDNIIMNIRPPTSIGRLPRGISDACRWKASEFRSWLLFYSLPIISKHMAFVYSQHWSLFVMSIYLLLKEEISPTDIDMAETMLKLFVRDIGQLYREKDYLYNVHTLIHLPLYVRRWGPLWATSAFGFESYYGVLAHCIHGSKNPGKELVKNIKLVYGIQILRNKIALQSNVSENLSTDNHVQLMNKCLIKLSEAERHILHKNGLLHQNICVFSRAKINREIFTSLLYTAEKKRNNYTVQFVTNEPSFFCGYGEIKFFLSVSMRDNDTYVIIKVLNVNHRNIICHHPSRTKVSHIIPVNNSEELLLIKMNNILCKVIRVTDYVCHHPNHYERNM